MKKHKTKILAAAVILLLAAIIGRVVYSRVAVKDLADNNGSDHRTEHQALLSGKQSFQPPVHPVCKIRYSTVLSVHIYAHEKEP